MDHVTAVEGNISLQNSSGQTIVLTNTGLDSDPWLALGGRAVLFLRHSREDMFRTSVYEIDVETHAVRLVYSGPVKFEGHQSSNFGRPELDESQNTLFLISKEFATTGSLVAIQLPNGQPRLITDHVVGYDIIKCLKNRGDIVVLKRHEDILGTPYFLHWLFSARGEELGLAGAEELNVEALREGTCDFAGTPTQALRTTPPLGDAIRIDSDVMKRRLIAQVEPIYPNEAQRERIQGEIRLEVRIAANGTVQEASLVSGPPQLAAAAIAAVKQWKYRPMIVSGHPVRAVTVVNLQFQLH